MANPITAQVIANAKADLRAKFPSEVAEDVLQIVKAAVDQVYTDIAAEVATLNARIDTLHP